MPKPKNVIPLVSGLIFALCAIAETAADESIEQPRLVWRNGDELAGGLLPASGERIGWRSDAFTIPFRIDRAQLERVRFPQGYGGTAQEGTGEFRITFANGDRLLGDVVEIGPEQVAFRCPVLGETIGVAREHLQRIERVSGSHLRYSGPAELERWKVLGRSATEEDWFVRSTGEFTTHRWGGELFREIALPQKAEIAFTVLCPNERPSFEIGLTEDPDSGPRIETWDDTLVLTEGNRFRRVLTMADSNRRLDLRIFWDQSRNQVRVCNPDGETLARLDDLVYRAPGLPETASAQRRRTSSNSRDGDRVGFRILNWNTELALARLTVREWDGESIPRFDATKPRMEMSGGEILFEIDRLEYVGGQLRIGDRGLSLNSLDQLVFRTERLGGRSEEAAHANWYDGASLSGALIALGPDTVRIRPPWHDGPLEARLRGVKELTFPKSREPLVLGGDRLKSGDIDLGGVLTSSADVAAEMLLAWRPAGSANASPFAESREVEVTREAYPGATELVGEARVYLTNDEVVAGSLVRIDAEKVEFVSDLTGRVSIPNRDVRAVDIEGAGLAPNGFVDKGWQIIGEGSDFGDENLPNDDADQTEGSDPPGVVMENDRVVLRDGGFGHPNLLVGDRIRFRTRWEQSYGAITLRLFCSDFEAGSTSMDLIIAAQGNRILVGQLKRGGGFSFSGEQISIKDQEAEIEVLARHDVVEVSVNGKRSLTLEVKPEQVSGNGLAIEMGGGWQGWNSNANKIEFTDFSIDRSPGYLPKRIIDPTAKENILSIPRFHRKDPPTHVLVAPNGDLLRGQLVAAEGDRIRFSSRGEEIELPRSRVSAVIWLREEEDEELEEEPRPSGAGAPGSTGFPVTHQFVLHDGTRLHLAREGIEEEVFVGRSSVLGLCRVPIQSMRTMKQGPAHPLGRASDQMAYTDWRMAWTPEPAIPSGDGSDGSPLIGTAAPDFTLPLLGGGEFSLADHRGRVVVLDFWATWCGPCIRAMPEVFRAVSLFRHQPVVFCAVNQSETPPIISDFLETRGWNGTTVGLDFELEVSRGYEVNSIPQTVVIGKDGKIAWLHTGYSPDLGQKLAEAIAKALGK